MKLIYIFLTTLLFTIYSAACAQRITYSAKNVQLKTIFSAIQKQTGYGFFYDQKLLIQAKTVSLNVKNEALSNVLSTIFQNQTLNYSIQNKTILITKKKALAAHKPDVKSKPVVKQSAKGIAATGPLLAMESEGKTLPENDETTVITTDSMINGINNNYVKPAQKQAVISEKTLLKGEAAKNTNLLEPSPAKVDLKDVRKKYLYAELGGGSIGLSVNYDVRFKRERNDGFGFRVGVGISRDFLSVPLGINYILGKKRSGLEAGIEYNPGLNIFGWESLNHNYHPRRSLQFNAGCRLQSYNKFMLRTNIQFIYLSRGDWARIPGISLGYGLNRSRTK